MTTDDFYGMNPQDFADYVYEEKEMGYGSSESGILLVVNFDSGDWIISTAGDAISAFTDAGQKAALRTVRRQVAAKEYMKPGSLNLTAQNEQYLYNTVDRIKKESSSGGGSSTHESSSGMTHGGSSGKF